MKYTYITILYIAMFLVLYYIGILTIVLIFKFIFGNVHWLIYFIAPIIINIILSFTTFKCKFVHGNYTICNSTSISRLYFKLTKKSLCPYVKIDILKELVTVSDDVIVQEVFYVLEYKVNKIIGKSYRNASKDDILRLIYLYCNTDVLLYVSDTQEFEKQIRAEKLKIIL